MDTYAYVVSNGHTTLAAFPDFPAAILWAHKAADLLGTMNGATAHLLVQEWEGSVSRLIEHVYASRSTLCSMYHHDNCTGCPCGCHITRSYL